MTVARKTISSVALASTYAAIATPLFAAWEVSHLPLYTIWREEPLAESLRAAAHCTIGDAGIAFACAFLAATIVQGGRPQSARSFSLLTVFFGIASTILIETLSTGAFGRWTYAPMMPIAPFVGVGWSPIAQWIVVPAIALMVIRRKIAAQLCAGADLNARRSSARAIPAVGGNEFHHSKGDRHA